MSGLKRYRVPMYVEVDCLGTGEGDAANRAAAAFYNLNLSGQELLVELRPGTPMPAEEGDARLRIFEAEHIGNAVAAGHIRLVRAERT